MSKDMGQRVLPVIIATVTGGLLMLIPGGLVVEAFLATIAAGVTSMFNIPKDNKLANKKESIKLQAKSQIRQQRAHITNSFIECVEDINTGYYESINAKISGRDEKNKERIEKICRLDQKLQDILEFIHAEKNELKKI